jgi:enterochelin esterase-like enzyme
MKRKILYMTLFIMLLVQCVCCGKNNETKETAQAANVPSEAVTPTETPVPTKADPTSTPTPTEAPKEEEKVPAAISTMIPRQYTEMQIKDGGKVERFEYGTKDYFGDGADITKRAYIYLPKDYDPEKQYNVLILCHGIGGSENEWGMGGLSSKVKAIMDNLVLNDEAEPFLVVTPNGRSSKDFANTSSDYGSFYLFGQELRNDLIPYINEHYATYGKNAESFEEVRDHYAMAGLSMGGMQTINIGMCECLDMFSWFGAFSAAPTSYAAATVKEKIEAEGDYTINFFYNICGQQDGVALSSHTAAAKNLALLSDRFTDGENYMWMTCPGGHDFNIWYLGFYNFAQIVFRGPKE